jgi:hypothetical protein
MNAVTSLQGELFQFGVNVCAASPSTKQMSNKKGRQLRTCINAARDAGAIWDDVKFNSSPLFQPISLLGKE